MLTVSTIKTFFLFIFFLISEYISSFISVSASYHEFSMSSVIRNATGIEKEDFKLALLMFIIICITVFVIVIYRRYIKKSNNTIKYVEYIKQVKHILPYILACIVYCLFAATIIITGYSYAGSQVNSFLAFFYSFLFKLFNFTLLLIYARFLLKPENKFKSVKDTLPYLLIYSCIMIPFTFLYVIFNNFNGEFFYISKSGIPIAVILYFATYILVPIYMAFMAFYTDNFTNNKKSIIGIFSFTCANTFISTISFSTTNLASDVIGSTFVFLYIAILKSFFKALIILVILMFISNLMKKNTKV